MNNGTTAARRTIRQITTKVAVAGLAVAGLALGVSAASAAAPTWTPSDPNLVGGVTLYDATGAKVVSGSLADGQIAAYAVGDTALPGTGTRGTLYAYTPRAGSGGTPVLPGLWTGAQLTANTVTPTNLPAGVPTGKPIATLDAGATTLGQYVAGYPSSVTAEGYTNVYELRLRTDGPGSSSIAYDAVDVVVNGDTWAVVGTGISTTTTLAVTPAGAHVGDPLTLSATVAPAEAAGTVQFFDGATSRGTASVVDGTATTTTPALAGTHSYTAVFTPTDALTYLPSTSPAVSYTATQDPASTTTTLAVTPAAPKAGGTLGFTATVAPDAPGTVQFYDGTKALGAAKPVASGKASTTAAVTTAGAHTFRAVFTPTDATAYTTSTGTKAVSVAKAASTIKITAPAKVKATKKAKLTATVTATGLTVAGKVTILDGSKKLGTATIKSGKVTYTLPKLKKGKHTIKVTFAGNANIAASSATKKITSS